MSSDGISPLRRKLRELGSTVLPDGKKPYEYQEVTGTGEYYILVFVASFKVFGEVIFMEQLSSAEAVGFTEEEKDEVRGRLLTSMLLHGIYRGYQLKKKANENTE